MMRNFFWKTGLFIILSAISLWAIAAPTDFYFMTTHELIGAIIIGGILILPEFIYQCVQLLSSKPKF